MFCIIVILGKMEKKKLWYNLLSFIDCFLSREKKVCSIRKKKIKGFRDLFYEWEVEDNSWRGF